MKRKRAGNISVQPGGFGVERKEEKKGGSVGVSTGLLGEGWGNSLWRRKHGGTLTFDATSVTHQEEWAERDARIQKCLS